MYSTSCLSHYPLSPSQTFNPRHLSNIPHHHMAEHSPSIFNTSLLVTPSSTEYSDVKCICGPAQHAPLMIPMAYGSSGCTVLRVVPWLWLYDPGYSFSCIFFLYGFVILQCFSQPTCGIHTEYSVLRMLYGVHLNIEHLALIITTNSKVFSTEPRISREAPAPLEYDDLACAFWAMREQISDPDLPFMCSRLSVCTKCSV